MELLTVLAGISSCVTGIGAALILLGIVLHNYHKAGADVGAMAEGETSHAA